MGQLGDLLRKSRETKGLSLEEVEETTRIRRGLLEALEEEAYDKFPAPVFVKGLLRNYADFLGLDHEEVLHLYKESAGSDALEYRPHALSEPLTSVQRMTPWPIIILALILIVVLMGVWAYQQGWLVLPDLGALWAEQRAGWSPPTPSATAPAATLTPSTSMAINVELEFQRETWLRVYLDGSKVFDASVPRGTRQLWTAKRQLYLHCAEGIAVRAIVNGQEYGLLGKDAEPVRVEWAWAPGTPSAPSTIPPTQVVLPAATP